MQNETKRNFRLLFVFLLFASPVILSACDLCGCFIGVLPYDNQSSFSFQHRYRVFSGYSRSTGMLFPSGAYRVAPPNGSVLHGTMQTSSHSAADFESYKVFELRGKWFIHPRIELNFVLPVLDNRSETGGIKSRATGLGDMTILAGYHLIRKTGDGNFRHRLLVGTGIKLPTGNDSRKDADGTRLPFMQQTGTGSTDAIFYSAYTGGGFNFRWGLTASLKLSGANQYGEQVGWAQTGTAFAGYLIKAGKWTLLPQAQFYQERMDGIWQSNELVDGTAMNSLLGGPALSVFHGNWTADMGFQTRVYDHTAEGNLLNKARMFISLSWNFNQQKYLLQSSKKD